MRAEGVHEFGGWRDRKTARVVGLAIGCFGALHAAYATVMTFSDERRSQWTTDPDDVLFLSEPEAA